MAKRATARGRRTGRAAARPAPKGGKKAAGTAKRARSTARARVRAVTKTPESAPRRPQPRPRAAARRVEREATIPTPPSSLDLDRHPSAARSGRAEIAGRLRDHRETGPELTGGDPDAAWEAAYAVGDEAPGGDNPTPDQDVVDDIGRSLGIQYEDNEELRPTDKVAQRDRHRWELDPASAEDYRDRTKK
jgi:hypothetical protein